MSPQIDSARRRVRLDPRDPRFFNDPYSAYAEIRAATPVFFWEQYGFWCFAAYSEVSALLRDRRFGRQILHVMSRESLGWPAPPAHLEPFDAIERHSLLELEPPEHTRLRALVNRAFLSRQVERLAPRIADLANDLIDAFEAQGEAELIGEFATPIPVAVIAELIGVAGDMESQLLEWSHRMVAMYQFGVTRAVEDAAATAASEFAQFLRETVAARRGDPRDDLISQLIAAEADGARLSPAELVATCILLLNAGHEATVHGLGNSVKTILETRVEGAQAFADPRASEAMVEELLRFDPPLHLFTRYALEDVEVAGVRLRQGERVGLLLGAANRDPKAFAQSDRFEPTRAPNPHVTFGAGIHFCLGAPLARLELRAALPILFRRLPGLRLAHAPRYRDAYHFHGLEALRVAW